jgi:N-acetylglutamate synthase-like GNAT family acetyltransferase
MSAPELRAFESGDLEACMALLHGNVPRFFTVNEASDFRAFLEQPGDYFTLWLDGRIIGCGGYWLNNDGTAHLTWGMVDAALHRRGYGQMLLLERLRCIALEAPGTAVILDTTQHSAPFFARYGFQTVRVTPNFYAPGTHRHDLRLEPDALRRTLEEMW